MRGSLFLYFLLVTSCSSFCQSVGIGTTTPAGKLHIKGSADVTQLIIDANVSQSNTNPLIRLRNSGGTDLMHIHSDNTNNTFVGYNTGRVNNAGGGGIYNTFIGSTAGYSNTIGSANTANGMGALYSNTSGGSNTAIGFQSMYLNTLGNGNVANGVGSLYSNSNGENNTAIGFKSLYSNTAGSNNVANGYLSLYSNTTGGANTSIGLQSLYSNISGDFNTACGNAALFSNTVGADNTAIGISALYHNTAGFFNTAVGENALFNTTASYYNTSVGYHAGDSYDNGYNNVFVGANVDVTGAGFYNVIAIGQGTVVSGPSAAVFGNSSTVSYSGYTNWTSISDGRYKKNVQENVPRLDFINKLRPITYNLDATGLDAFLHKNEKKEEQSNGAARNIYNKALQEKEKIIYTGFIAQEVATAAKELGFNFSGVDAPKNDNDVYGLRYAEFVVPLVKAVQEQQQMIQSMKKRIDALEEQNKLLQQLLEKKN